MNRILTILFATSLIGGVSLCGTLLSAQQSASEPTSPATQAPVPQQTAQPPAAAQASPASGPARVAAGSVIPVELTKTIDAKKAKAGEEVVARVTQDLRSNTGALIMPKDTKVIGHVTEAQARNKEQKESQLAITFEKAVLRNGETMQMPMSIQAVIAPPSGNPNQASAGTPNPTPGMPGAGTTPGGGSGPGGPSTAGSPQGPSGAGNQMPTGVPQSSGDTSTEPATSRPPINGNTQGVIGIANLNLAAAQSPAQGSLMSSDKNNVKLEDGTMLLLRVNQ